MSDAFEAIDALAAGIAAGRGLSLDVEPAEAVHREATVRLGIAPDAYVVALVGGTGVGKSTLLNALAGEVVSEASARRPTTGRPVAWVAAKVSDELRPLLERLDVETLQTHERDGLERVVVLDLPDVDSLDPEHRSTVEKILPKVDVVAWVTDPEKYADAALHDDFLRTWLGRLDRQILLVNKTDRLEGDQVEKVTRDLAALLGREVPGFAHRVPRVLPVAAIQGDAGIEPLRAWLAEAVEAKEVVADRLTVAARAALASLAADAGVSAPPPATGGQGTDGAVLAPLLAPADRARAVEAAADAALRVADLRGAQDHAVNATRARARRRGTGPIGILTSAAWRLGGRERRSADPGGYLRGWRSRGGLTRAADAVRRVIAESMPNVPPKLRSRYAATTGAGDLERKLEAALDRVVGRQPELEPPSSRLWSIIGLLQTANTLVLVFAVAWVVVLALAHPAVASVELPVLGPVPTPLLLLAAALVSGYILARALGFHAGWLGRRWGRRISRDISDAVRQAVEGEAFAAIDKLDAARTALAAAVGRVSRAVS